MEICCDDMMLAQELASGSYEAFDKLYLMYSPIVESFALCMLKDHSDASDLCQSIFLKVWERRKSFNGVRSFKAYLYKMTRNAILNELEKKKQTSIHALPSSVIQEFSIDGADKVCSDKDLLLLIELAVNTMPQKSRDIFYMSRRDEMSHKEIARALDISVKTVEYHISKVLAHLRKLTKILILFI